MQLTRQGDYAVRTVLYLAQLSEKKLVQTKDIAKAQDIPEAFLNKIVQSLAKAGLVETVRGAQGGIRLARPGRDISLKQVIEAVEGPILLNRCLMAEGTCEKDAYCPVHNVWHKAQEALLGVLEVNFETLSKQ